MKKILIQLTQLDFKLSKKVVFSLQELSKKHQIPFFFKKSRKKFVQTRYQQSKERFCIFQHKASVPFDILSTKKAVRKTFQKVLIVGSMGFFIKQ